jgi:uncharacterized membrane protein
MKRPARVALNILLPPLLAAGCFLAFMCVIALGESFNSPNRNATDVLRGAGQLGFMVFLVAYMVAGLPSLLHSAIMEIAYRKVPPEGWVAVGISTMNGTLAGILIATFFLSGQAPSAPVILGFVLLGAFVGFLLGIFIKRLSTPKLSNNRPALHGCE